ncbi:high mobility group protein 20A [Phlebotomus argentipes]|uniref:high mobility group protein 20A n=1 Tax=Phlebotomus argentipes TaxID=94469 RepID=UPI002892B4BF|nr:high mobility group protein 20A [Phlebotomus argentipes]
MNSEEKDPLAISEEEAPRETAAAAAPIVKRRRKRKKLPKDGPKPIITGYVRYMNENREIIRGQFPDVPIGEITRKLAQGWAGLTDEQKKPYLDAADLDKDRFSREMQEYRENQAKKMAIEEPKVTQVVEERPKSVEKPTPTENFEHKNGDFDIPIFTDEFLDHNKIVEAELRALRKSFTDYEQQNSVLEKHVENMRNGINKLTNETTDMTTNNKVLLAYLEKLRSKLVNAMGSLPMASGSEHNITMDNIDDFLQDLPTAHGAATLNKAKDLIRKLDLNIQV